MLRVGTHGRDALRPRFGVSRLQNPFVYNGRGASWLVVTDHRPVLTHEGVGVDSRLSLRESSAALRLRVPFRFIRLKRTWAGDASQNAVAPQDFLRHKSGIQWEERK